ncbi:MAG: phosphotransferase [Pseudomonadota bacterium]|nr:phosphotransferase [Pseudomonadota bacterium]
MQIHRLASGLVNDSFRVARAGRQYALRVTHPESGAHGLDQGFNREWECNVLRCAAAAGLAPAIEHCDPAEGVLVSRWVSGRVWSPQEIQRPETIEAMGLLLRKVHALRIPQPARTMNPAAWIAQYAQALAGSGAWDGIGSGPCAVEWQAAEAPTALRNAADANLALLAASPAPAPVLCHSDLHRHNLIAMDPGAGARVLLLDWEYAHVSDPYWDVAGWAANNELAQATALLSSYLGRTAQADECARLSLFMWLYDYVCLLWSELYLAQRPGAAGAHETTEGRAHGVITGVAHAAAEGVAANVAPGLAIGPPQNGAESVAKRAERLRARLLASPSVLW